MIEDGRAAPAMIAAGAAQQGAALSFVRSSAVKQRSRLTLTGTEVRWV